ncbi:MAG: hypothetical protein QXT06_01540 [Candidatus Bathyarchaeia archaeon]
MFDGKVRPIMIGFLYGFGLAAIIRQLIRVPVDLMINYGLC